MTLDFTKEILPGTHWDVLNGRVTDMTYKQGYCFVWEINKKKIRMVPGNQAKEWNLDNVHLVRNILNSGRIWCGIGSERNLRKMTQFAQLRSLGPERKDNWKRRIIIRAKLSCKGEFQNQGIRVRLIETTCQEGKIPAWAVGYNSTSEIKNKKRRKQSHNISK